MEEQTKNVKDMTTAELGICYGKTIETVYKLQLQANTIENELNKRHEPVYREEATDVPCDNPE
ncbi:MAG: hypothetical protein ACYTBJ_26945 [Planctomycetota bacterium]|jgi:hypothetical protein